MTPDRSYVLEIRGLTKTYWVPRTQERVNALTAIDLAIAPGEFVSVVGPSGSGKSTLMKLIMGLVTPTSGEILLAGKPVVGPRPDIGVVFQNAVLLPWRTAMENTLLPVHVLGRKGEPYTSRASQLLKMVGLEGFEGKYPNQLSGGMQQRVAITRALINDPSLLLMDEPFGALDAMTREQMNLELLRIWQESTKTIFFITHSIPEAVFLSDRVVVLSERPGRILEVISVNLPRPRHLGLMATREFGLAAGRIRSLLGVREGLDS